MAIYKTVCGSRRRPRREEVRSRSEGQSKVLYIYFFYDKNTLPLSFQDKGFSQEKTNPENESLHRKIKHFVLEYSLLEDRHGHSNYEE